MKNVVLSFSRVRSKRPFSSYGTEFGIAKHSASLNVLFLSLFVLFLTVRPAGAASETWTGTAATSNFNATTWTGTNIPPASNDAVIFGGGGAASQTIVMTSGYGTGLGSSTGLGNITFTAGANAYTFDLSSNSINISNPDSITLNTGVTNNETIGVSAGSGTIYVGEGSSGSTVNFINNGTGTLLINSNISSGAAGNDSITFQGSGPETFSGVISLAETLSKSNSGTLTEASTGVISGIENVVVNSIGYAFATAGTVNFLGNNTYTGTTTVGSLYNSGFLPTFSPLVSPTLTLSGANNGQGTITIDPSATLKLDFSSTGAPITNILNNSGSTTGVTLNGGTLSIKGKSGATNSQTLGAIVTSAQSSDEITFNQNGATSLSSTFGAMTRSAGGILDVTLPTTGTVTTSSTTFSNHGLLASAANGVAYATANNGTAWLGNTSGTLSVVTSTSGYATNNNVLVGSADAPGSAITVNSLLFNSNSSLTLLTGSVDTITSGGILITSNDIVSISGGTELKGGSNELVFIDNGTLSVGSTIGASGAAQLLTVGSTLGQTGTATFSSNNYLSGINLDSVRLNLTGNNTISGNVTIGYGATLNLSNSNTTTSSFTWTQGGGTLIASGAGSLGLGAILNSQNNTANTVELLSNANVAGSGTVNPTINITSGSYTATVSSAAGLNVGDTLSGYTGISSFTTIVGISGTTLTLSNAATATMTGVTGTINQAATIAMTVGDNPGIDNYIVDQATPGSTPTPYSLNVGTLGQQQVLNFLPGSNYDGTSGTTLTLQGSPTVGAPNGSTNTTINATGVNVTFTGGLEGVNQTSGTAGGVTETVTLNGTSTSNQISGSLNNGLSIGNITTYTLSGTSGSNTVTVSSSTGVVIGETLVGFAGITNGTIVEGVTGTTLTLSANNTGTVSGGGTIDTASYLALVKDGTGTWDLSGSNNQSGSTTVNGGILILDYTTNNNSKIGYSPLTFDGGTLELKGNSGFTQTVYSTTLGATTAQSALTASGSTNTIALGALTLSGGAFDIGSNVSATTTTTNTNGILSPRITFGNGAGFAYATGGTIAQYTGATVLSATQVGSTLSATGNYSIVGTTTVTTGSTATNYYTLQIDNSSVGTLNTSGQNLTSAAGGALLYDGSANFTITAARINTASGNVLLQDWGTGVLTLNAALASNLEKYGTGQTVLNSAATVSGGIFINAGTLQYSADNQLGIASTNTITINGSYGNGAALVADTTNAGGSLTNSRAISLGAQGGNFIDVINGGTLTLSGLISGTQTDSFNNIVTFGGAEAAGVSSTDTTTSGTIVLANQNSYVGGTTLAAGTVSLGAAENPGVGGPLGLSGTITFTGGTLQYSSANNFDYSGRFSVIANQSFNIDANGQNVNYATPLAGALSSLTYKDSNPVLSNGLVINGLTLSAQSTYTGATNVNSGLLTISSASHADLHNTSMVNLSGGTLLFGQLATTGANIGSGGTGAVNIAANGGTLGFVANSTGTINAGALTLAGGATGSLDFGSGSTNGNTLNFASLSLPTNSTLNIYDYQVVTSYNGTESMDNTSTQDHLLFTSNPGTVGETYTNIAFYTGSGTTASLYGYGYEVAFGGQFEIVGVVTPAPEPSTWFCAGALMALLVLRQSQKSPLFKAEA